MAGFWRWSWQQQQRDGFAAAWFGSPLLLLPLVCSCASVTLHTTPASAGASASPRTFDVLRDGGCARALPPPPPTSTHARVLRACGRSGARASMFCARLRPRADTTTALTSGQLFALRAGRNVLPARVHAGLPTPILHTRSRVFSAFSPALVPLSLCYACAHTVLLPLLFPTSYGSSSVTAPPLPGFLLLFATGRFQTP